MIRSPSAIVLVTICISPLSFGGEPAAKNTVVKEYYKTGKVKSEPERTLGDARAKKNG